MKENFHDVIRKSAQLTLTERHEVALDETRYQFSDEEMHCIEVLRESRAFADIPKHCIDRHSLREALVATCTSPISILEHLARKLNTLMEADEVSVDLGFSEQLTERLEKTSPQSRVNLGTIVEGMGSSTCDDHDGCADHGMFGVGDGGDKDEPKGDADGGANQKGDQGDHGHTAKVGYMDENGDFHEGEVPPQFKKHMKPKGSDADGDGKPDFSKMGKDKDEAHKKMSYEKGHDYPMGKNGEDMDHPKGYKNHKDEAYSEPPKDAPLATKPTAADDAKLSGDGVKQNGANEASHSYDKGSDSHDPKAADPGTGSADSGGDKSSEKGEVDPSHPNYSKAKEEDPSNDPKNKGPASAVNEEFVEATQAILATLAENGIEPGHEKFDEMFQKGWSHYLTSLAEAHKGNDDGEDMDGDDYDNDKHDKDEKKSY